MKKNILIIDDSLDRLYWFENAFEELSDFVTIDFAENSDSVLKAFQNKTYDLAFFDHDLGENSELNGSQIAYYVLNNPEEYKEPKTVWVQSSNITGAENIKSKFKSVGISCYVQSFESFMAHPIEFIQSVKNILKIN